MDRHAVGPGAVRRARRARVRRATGPSASLADYLALTEQLDPATYVPTHGEPDVHNQWRAADGRLVLLDWETLRSHRESDLPGGVADWVEGRSRSAGNFFELEWALSEVHSYSDWLRGPHGDDADTRTAISALAEELAKPAYSPS